MFSGLLRNAKAIKAASRSSAVAESLESLIEVEHVAKASKADKLHSFWVNGLLSSPYTQSRNVLANALARPVHPGFVIGVHFPSVPLFLIEAVAF